MLCRPVGFSHVSMLILRVGWVECTPCIACLTRDEIIKPWRARFSIKASFVAPEDRQAMVKLLRAGGEEVMFDGGGVVGCDASESRLGCYARFVRLELAVRGRFCKAKYC